MGTPRSLLRSTLTALALIACTATPRGQDGPPPAPREFRGAWIASVANIDWPSRPALSTEAARTELRVMIERAAEIGLNAIVFQIRPSGDALYHSELEPWSEWLTGEEGRAPRPLWDPLEFAITEAHARGLELHAWANPFRARHREAKSRPHSTHLEKRHPELCVRYGEYVWMDPGRPEARQWSLDVLFDVVERYDIDALHLDDYFYPYPEGERAFPDDRSWRAFGRDTHLSRADWRRRNVDRFLQRLSAGIRARRPGVRLGISPFGIWRPGHPKGVDGLDQFADLYADPRKWLRQGWVDYMVPQLYWARSARQQPYDALQDWWIEQNVKRRHLWIGNYTGRVLQGTWDRTEILAQIASTRRVDGAGGNLHYSMKVLMPGARGDVGDVLRDGPYRAPALVPASTWIDAEAPGPPTLVHQQLDRDVLDLRWHPDRDVFQRTLWVRDRGAGWRLFRVLPSAREGIRLSEVHTLDAVALSAVDRYGNESMRRVLTMPDR